MKKIGLLVIVMLFSIGALAYGTDYNKRVGSGTQSVDSAGTAIALSGDTACVKIMIKAINSNDDYIYVGNAYVNADNASKDNLRTGYPLSADDTLMLTVRNLDEVYIDATSSGDGVKFIYEI